jgi:Xanthomonas XOO_2897-like deaminase
VSLLESPTRPWLPDGETDDERHKRLRKMRNLRLAAIMRIFGLIATPLPAPALPTSAPVVEVDPRKRKNGGGQGGSREFSDARPGESVMDHLGRLAASTPDEAEAEAYVGALPALAAASVPSASPALIGAVPEFVTGMSTAARILRQHVATRGLVTYLPAVARRATLRINRRAAAGRHVTPELCSRMLAETAVEVLSEAAPEAPGGAATLGRLDAVRRTLAKMRTPIWHRYGRTTAPIDPRLLQRAKLMRAAHAGVSDKAFREYNVAVARVRVDGKIRYLSTVNTPTGLHAEQWIYARVHALGKPPRVVLEQLYTERIPCFKECGPLMRDKFPHASVYFTTAAPGPARGRQLRRAYGLGP